MLIEIKELTFNKKKEKVTIKGTDVESLILMDWDTEIEKLDKEFEFDLKKEGHRLYLYKVLSSHGKKDAKTLLEKLDSLIGKTIHLNPNFLVKAA